MDGGRRVGDPPLGRLTAADYEDDVAADPRMAGNHRVAAVRAHLNEMGNCHSTTGTLSGWNYGNRIDRSDIRQNMEQNCVSGFVICRNPFVLFRNNAALFLCTNSHFDKGLANIFVHQIRAVFSCGTNRSLVQKIFQIRTGKSCRCTCDFFQIYIIR